jgi:hypothetical protein
VSGSLVGLIRQLAALIPDGDPGPEDGA